MTRVKGSHCPRQLKIDICEAIDALRILEFDYGGYHRVVQSYSHGFTRKGEEAIRAVPVNAGGVLEIQCRVKLEPRPHGSG
jgi:hypothetical protein